MTRTMNRAKVVLCLSVALMIGGMPMQALALPECSEWADEVRGIERLTSPINISAEYHDLYCTQFGNIAGDSSLEDAKLVRNNTSYVVLRDGESGMVLGKYGDIRDDPESLYFHETSIPETPEGFPYVGILYARYGASNTYREYHIYSTEPELKQVVVIKSPVEGADLPKIEGFYVEGGQFLIDTLTTKGTPVGSCNACQKWNIEIFSLVNDELQSVYLGQSDDQSFDFVQWLYTVAYKIMN